MNKKLFWTLIFGVAIFGTLAATRALWLNPQELTFLRPFIPKINILPEKKSLAYEQACAACHMAYAPSTLPSRSWKNIMDGLEDHFGDNAEVSSEVGKEVSAYLQNNAADHVENIYAQPMLHLLKDTDTPLRVSSTPYFKFLHDIVTDEMVEGNLQVLSYARCEVCHHEATGGRFNKFAVRIPNYTFEGRWLKAPTLEPKQ